MCKSQLTAHRNQLNKLRKDAINMSRDQTNLVQKIEKLKKERTVYQRDSQWYTKWKSMPKCIMGEYQDSKEEPKQVYRLLKILIVDEPERVEHDKIYSLLKRYKTSLPDTMEMMPAKNYITLRMAELTQMVNKENYTKQELIRIASTVLSEVDATKSDENLAKSMRDLRNYAQAKVQKKVMDCLKKTTTKPEDMWIDNPLHRKRMFVHKQVVNNQPLPKIMIKNDYTIRGRGGGRGRGRGRGNSRFSNHKNFNGNSSNYNQQNNGGRGNGRGRGGRGGGRGRGGGGRAPFNLSQQNDNKENEAQSESSHVITKVKPYDLKKIPDKLDHFGAVSEDIQHQLQSQLIRNSIEIESD